MANRTSRDLEIASFKLGHASRRAADAANTAAVMRKQTPPGMLPVDPGLEYYNLLEAKEAIQEAVALIDNAMDTFKKLDQR